MTVRRIIGLDPGLQATGWGVIDAVGSRLIHVADGTVRSDPKAAMADRLSALFEGLLAVIEAYGPGEAAVEETFLNRNPGTTLKLGHARGVVLLAPATRGLSVAEYSAKHVKKALTGTGAAEKAQLEMMVRRLLPQVVPDSADSADALGVAICHAHESATLLAVARSGAARAATASRAAPRAVSRARRAGP